MNDGLSIKGRFLKGERITLTSGKHQFLAFVFFMLGIILTLVGAWLILKMDHVSIFFLIIVSVIFTLSFLFVYHSILLTDLGIKKDTLYISHFFTSCKVIGLDEIYKIRHFKLFGLNFIYLNYSCQKSCKKCLIIRNSSRDNLKKIQILLDEYENHQQGKSEN